MGEGGVDDETEERGSHIAIDQSVSLSEAKTQRSIYSKGRRDLNEAELASPVAARFMIDHIERLEDEAGKLSQYRDLYYKQGAELSEWGLSPSHTLQ